ncbi:MAG: bifunctional phosphopantothenoylcysteine decarboxylase/phosphopantothenate--cysteine ligase CoaBC [Desulfovibrionales bacterium]|nr:bifunctional phosphopantothenoylcysteine decarboxylase/phosphopantothenate--cysteine ligase CoaBC [Desulfovibrionales bacterium]
MINNAMLPDHYPIFRIFSGKRIHLGITGSVAAYKSIELWRLLNDSMVDAGATLTPCASQFIGPMTLSALGVDPVYSGSKWNHSDPYPHLFPAHSAHTFAVVPATANIMANAARGLANDLLSTQILAYNNPVHFFPAMNPGMWSNAATQDNVKLLDTRGHRIILPHEGKVACGDEGQGKLAPVPVIYYHILKALSPQDMAGQSILVTAGPTHEYFDLVRYISNPSSGRMGLAIALTCWLRGARVFFVHGPIGKTFPLPRFDLLPVTSARDMFSACSSVWDQCDKGIFSAAVSDFAPVPCTDLKFKKTGLDSMKMDMNSNPDILATLSAKKNVNQITVGFAAEASDLEFNARDKLQRKNLDIIVANLVRTEQTPFGSPDNQVLVMDKKGRTESWPSLSKAQVAWRLVDWFTLI